MDTVADTVVPDIGLRMVECWLAYTVLDADKDIDLLLDRHLVWESKKKKEI